MSYILVVEDDERWQDQIVEFLEEGDHISICVSTLESAMKALDESIIDLAVVDINLTDVIGNQDGIKIIKYLEDTGRSIPVIIVSGTIPANSFSLTKKVLGFFSKQSFDPDEFLNTVSQALHSE